MGNVECCQADQKDYKQPQIIQPRAEPVSKQLIRIQQYYESHPIIKRILKQSQVREQQQKIINKDQFLSNAVSKQTQQGYYIYNDSKLQKKAKNNYGIILYNDGSYYEGELLNNIKSGKGMLAYQSGEYYCGEWICDMPHGQGIYCSLQPYAYYKGEWHQGQQHGQGAEHTQDGSKYVGSFNYGKKEGRGKLIYKDKTEYEGQFKNNLPEGLGIYKGKTNIYEGSWEKGKMHGSGHNKWFDERNQIIAEYKGEYKDGIKEGYGDYTDNKGTIFRAMWINGQINEFAPIDVEKKL